MILLKKKQKEEQEKISNDFYSREQLEKEGEAFKNAAQLVASPAEAEKISVKIDARIDRAEGIAALNSHKYEEATKEFDKAEKKLEKFDATDVKELKRDIKAERGERNAGNILNKEIIRELESQKKSDQNKADYGIYARLNRAHLYEGDLKKAANSIDEGLALLKTADENIQKQHRPALELTLADTLFKRAQADASTKGITDRGVQDDLTKAKTLFKGNKQPLAANEVDQYNTYYELQEKRKNAENKLRYAELDALGNKREGDQKSEFATLNKMLSEQDKKDIPRTEQEKKAMQNYVSLVSQDMVDVYKHSNDYLRAASAETQLGHKDNSNLFTRKAFERLQEEVVEAGYAMPDYGKRAAEHFAVHGLNNMGTEDAILDYKAAYGLTKDERYDKSLNQAYFEHGKALAETREYEKALALAQQANSEGKKEISTQINNYLKREQAEDPVYLERKVNQIRQEVDGSPTNGHKQQELKSAEEQWHQASLSDTLRQSAHMAHEQIDREIAKRNARQQQIDDERRHETRGQIIKRLSDEYVTLSGEIGLLNAAKKGINPFDAAKNQGPDTLAKMTAYALTQNKRIETQDDLANPVSRFEADQYQKKWQELLKEAPLLEKQKIVATVQNLLGEDIAGTGKIPMESPYWKLQDTARIYLEAGKRIDTETKQSGAQLTPERINTIFTDVTSDRNGETNERLKFFAESEKDPEKRREYAQLLNEARDKAAAFDQQSYLTTSDPEVKKKLFQRYEGYLTERATEKRVNSFEAEKNLNDRGIGLSDWVASWWAGDTPDKALDNDRAQIKDILEERNLLRNMRSEANKVPEFNDNDIQKIAGASGIERTKYLDTYLKQKGLELTPEKKEAALNAANSYATADKRGVFSEKRISTAADTSSRVTSYLQDPWISTASHFTSARGAAELGITMGAGAVASIAARGAAAFVNAARIAKYGVEGAQEVGVIARALGTMGGIAVEGTTFEYSERIGRTVLPGEKYKAPSVKDLAFTGGMLGTVHLFARIAPNVIGRTIGEDAIDLGKATKQAEKMVEAGRLSGSAKRSVEDALGVFRGDRIVTAAERYTALDIVANKLGTGVLTRVGTGTYLAGTVGGMTAEAVGLTAVGGVRTYIERGEFANGNDFVHSLVTVAGLRLGGRIAEPVMGPVQEFVQRKVLEPVLKRAADYGTSRQMEKLNNAVFTADRKLTPPIQRAADALPSEKSSEFVARVEAGDWTGANNILRSEGTKSPAEATELQTARELIGNLDEFSAKQKVKSAENGLVQAYEKANNDITAPKVVEQSRLLFDAQQKQVLAQEAGGRISTENLVLNLAKIGKDRAELNTLLAEQHAAKTANAQSEAERAYKEAIATGHKEAIETTTKARDTAKKNAENARDAWEQQVERNLEYTRKHNQLLYDQGHITTDVKDTNDAKTAIDEMSFEHAKLNRETRRLEAQREEIEATSPLLRTAEQNSEAQNIPEKIADAKDAAAKKANDVVTAKQKLFEELAKDAIMGDNPKLADSLKNQLQFIKKESELPVLLTKDAALSRDIADKIKERERMSGKEREDVQSEINDLERQREQVSLDITRKKQEIAETGEQLRVVSEINYKAKNAELTTELARQLEKESQRYNTPEKVKEEVEHERQRIIKTKTEEYQRQYEQAGETEAASKARKLAEIDAKVAERNVAGRKARVENELADVKAKAVAIEAAGAAPAIIEAIAAKEVIVSGKARLEITEEGKRRGIDKDIEKFNKLLDRLDNIHTTLKQKAGKITQGEIFDIKPEQIEPLLHSLSGKNKLIEAAAGIGKTSKIIPYAVTMLKLLYGKKVVLLFASKASIDGFKTEVGTNYEFFKESGLKVEEFSRENPRGDADVIITTPEIFFEYIRGETASKQFIKAINGATLVADEAQLTIPLNNRYSITKGKQIAIAELDVGKSAIEGQKKANNLLERVAKKTGVPKEALIGRDEKNNPIFKNKYRDSVYQELIKTSEGYRKLSSEEKIKIDALRGKELEKYVGDLLVKEGIESPYSDIIAMLNTYKRIAGQTLGTDFDYNHKEGIITPRERGHDSGKRFQSVHEVVGYETWGRELLRAKDSTIPKEVDFGKVGVSDNSAETTTLEFLSKVFGQVIGFTGTPGILEKAFRSILGVETVFRGTEKMVTEGGAKFREVNTVKRTLEDIVDDTRYKDMTYINTATRLSDRDLAGRIREMYKGKDAEIVFVSPRDGQLRRSRIDAEGRESEVKRYNNFDELNDDLSAMYKTGKDRDGRARPERLIKYYEKGMDVGTDLPIAKTEKVRVIADEGSTLTDVVQGRLRDRGNNARERGTKQFSAFAYGELLVFDAKKPYDHNEAFDLFRDNEHAEKQRQTLEGLEGAYRNIVTNTLRRIGDIEQTARGGEETPLGIAKVMQEWQSRAGKDLSLDNKYGDTREHIAERINQGLRFVNDLLTNEYYSGLRRSLSKESLDLLREQSGALLNPTEFAKRFTEGEIGKPTVQVSTARNLLEAAEATLKAVGRGDIPETTLGKIGPSTTTSVEAAETAKPLSLTESAAQSTKTLEAATMRYNELEAKGPQRTPSEQYEFTKILPQTIQSAAEEVRSTIGDEGIALTQQKADLATKIAPLAALSALTPEQQTALTSFQNQLAEADRQLTSLIKRGLIERELPAAAHAASEEKPPIPLVVLTKAKDILRTQLPGRTESEYNRLVVTAYKATGSPIAEKIAETAAALAVPVTATAKPLQPQALAEDIEQRIETKKVIPLLQKVLERQPADPEIREFDAYLAAFKACSKCALGVDIAGKLRSYLAIKYPAAKRLSDQEVLDILKVRQTPEGVLAFAVDYFTYGLYEEAISGFEKYLTTPNPKYGDETVMYLAEVHYKSQNYEKAKEYAQEALKSEKLNAEQRKKLSTFVKHVEQASAKITILKGDYTAGRKTLDEVVQEAYPVFPAQTESTDTNDFFGFAEVPDAAQQAVRMITTPGRATTVLYDTGGLIKMHRAGNFLAELVALQALGVATGVVDAAVAELERQRDAHREDEEGRLVPPEVTNKLYEEIGKGSIKRITSQPSEERKTTIRRAQQAGAPNKNSRLSEADIQLMHNAIEEAVPGAGYTIVIAADTDIAYIANSIKPFNPNIIVLSPKQYGNMIKKLEERKLEEKPAALVTAPAVKSLHLQVQEAATQAAKADVDQKEKCSSDGSNCNVFRGTLNDNYNKIAEAAKTLKDPTASKDWKAQAEQQLTKAFEAIHALLRDHPRENQVQQQTAEAEDAATRYDANINGLPIGATAPPTRAKVLKEIDEAISTIGNRLPLVTNTDARSAIQNLLASLQKLRVLPLSVKEEFSNRKVLALGERPAWAVFMQNNYGTRVTIATIDEKVLAAPESIPTKKQNYFETFSLGQFDAVTLNFPDYDTSGDINILIQNIASNLKADGKFFLVSEQTLSSRILRNRVQKEGFIVEIDGQNAADVLPGYTPDPTKGRESAEGILEFPLTTTKVWVLRKASVDITKFPFAVDYLSARGIKPTDVRKVFGIEMPVEDILENIDGIIGMPLWQEIPKEELWKAVDQAIEFGKIGRHLFDYPLEKYGNNVQWLAAVARGETDEKGIPVTKTSFLDAFRHSLEKLATDYTKRIKPALPAFAMSPEELKAIKFRDIPLWMTHVINGKRFEAYSSTGRKIILIPIDENGRIVEKGGTRFELQNGKYVSTTSISPDMYEFGLNDGVIVELQEKYSQLAPFVQKVNDLRSAYRVDSSIKEQLQAAEWGLLEKRTEIEGIDPELIFIEERTQPPAESSQQLKEKGQLAREKPNMVLTMLLSAARQLRAGRNVEPFKGVLRVSTGELRFNSAIIPHQDIMGGNDVVDPHKFQRIDGMSLDSPFRHLFIEVATGFDTPQTLKYYNDLALYPETAPLDSTIVQFSMTGRAYLFVHGKGLVDITKKYQELTFQRPANANQQIQRLLEEAKKCGGKITGAATCPVAVFIKLEQAMRTNNINDKYYYLRQARELLQKVQDGIPATEAAQALTPEDIDQVIASIRETKSASPLAQLIQKIKATPIKPEVMALLIEIDEALSSWRYDTVARALEQLNTYGPDALPALPIIHKVMQQTPPYPDLVESIVNMQSNALQVLGKIGSISYVSDLHNALENAHPRIRLNAAIALGIMGERSSKREQEKIIAALGLLITEEKYEGIRSAAIFALGNIGSPEARANLEELVHLKEYEKNDRDIANILISLGEMGHDAIESWETIIPFTSINQPKYVRVTALKTIGRIGSPEGIPVLIEALGDKDTEIHDAAEFGLHVARKEAVPALIKVIDNKNRNVRQSASKILSEGGIDTIAAVPVLMKKGYSAEAISAEAILLHAKKEIEQGISLTEEQKETAAQAIVTALAYKLSPTALPLGLFILKATGATATDAAMMALSEGRIGPEIAKVIVARTATDEQLQLMLLSENAPVRTVALSVFIQQKGAEAIPTLMDALHDASPEVLIASLTFFLVGRIHLLSSEQKRLLGERVTELVEHPRPAVTAKAITILAELGNQDYLPIIVKFIEDNEYSFRAIIKQVSKEWRSSLGIERYTLEQSQAVSTALSSLAAFGHAAIPSIIERIKVPAVQEGIFNRAYKLFDAELDATINNDLTGFRNWIENDPQNAALLLFDNYPRPEEITSPEQRQEVVTAIKQDLRAARVAQTKYRGVAERYVNGRVVERKMLESPEFVRAKELKLKRLAQMLRNVGEQEAAELQEAERLLQGEAPIFREAERQMGTVTSPEMEQLIAQDPTVTRETALVVLDKLQSELQLPTVLPEEVLPAMQKVKPMLKEELDIDMAITRKLAIAAGDYMGALVSVFTLNPVFVTAGLFAGTAVGGEALKLAMTTSTRQRVEEILSALEEILNLPPDKVANRVVPFEHLYTVARQIHNARADLSDEYIVTRLKELYNARIFAWQIEQLEEFWVLPDIEQAIAIAKSNFPIEYAKAFWNKGAGIHDIAELSERYRTTEGQVTVDLMYHFLPQIERFRMDDYNTLEKRVMDAEMDVLAEAVALPLEEDTTGRIRELLRGREAEVVPENEVKLIEQKRCESPCKERNAFMAALAQAAGLALSDAEREKAQSEGKIVVSLPNGVFVTQEAHNFLQKVVDVKFFESLLEYSNPKHAQYDEVKKVLHQAEQDGKVRTALERAVVQMAKAGIALHENNAFAARDAIRNAVREMNGAGEGITQQLNAALDAKDYRTLMQLLATPESATRQAVLGAMGKRGLAGLAPPFEPALYLKYAYAYAAEEGVRFLMDYVMPFAQQNELQPGWALLYLARAYRMNPEHVKDILGKKPHLATLEIFADEELRIRSATAVTTGQLKKNLLVGDRIHGTSLGALESVRSDGLELSKSFEGEAVVAATEVDNPIKNNLNLLDPLSYAIGRSRERGDWPILLRISRNNPEQPKREGPGYNEIWYHNNIHPEYIEYFNPFTGEWKSITKLTPLEGDSLKKQFSDAWKKQQMQVQGQDKLLVTTNQIYMDTPQYERAYERATAVKTPSLVGEPTRAEHDFTEKKVLALGERLKWPQEMQKKYRSKITILNNEDEALYMYNAYKKIYPTQIEGVQFQRDDYFKPFSVPEKYDVVTLNFPDYVGIPNFEQLVTNIKNALKEEGKFYLVSEGEPGVVSGHITQGNVALLRALKEKGFILVLEGNAEKNLRGYTEEASSLHFPLDLAYVWVFRKSINVPKQADCKGGSLVCTVTFSQPIEDILVTADRITEKIEEATDAILPAPITSLSNDKRSISMTYKTEQQFDYDALKKEIESGLPSGERVTLATSSEEILRKDPHIISFETGRYTLPEIDYSQFSDQARAKYLVNRLDAFLNGPIIKDSFETHEKRVTWRETLPQDVRAYYETNSLRYNLIVKLTFSGWSIIRFYLGDAYIQNNEEVKTAVEEIEKLYLTIDKYDKLSLEDKVLHGKEIKRAAHNVLGALAAGKKAPKGGAGEVSPLQKGAEKAKPLAALTLDIGGQSFPLPKVKVDENIDAEGLLRLIANTADWPQAEKKIKDILAENNLEEGVVVDGDGDLVLYVKDSEGVIRKVGVKAFEQAVSEQVEQPVSCGLGSGFCGGMNTKVLPSIGSETVLRGQTIDIKNPTIELAGKIVEIRLSKSIITLHEKRGRFFLTYEGRDIPLDKPVTKIGRDSGNDIVIEYPSVSRRHLEITYDKQKGISIRDLNSLNGLLISVGKELSPTENVASKNLEVMKKNTRGGMLDLVNKESMGGNAGFYQGYPAVAANFYFNPTTGEIVYFRNIQDVPPDIRAWHAKGTFLAAVDIRSGKYSIFKFWSDTIISGKTMQVMEESIQRFNKEGGFEIPKVTSTTPKGELQMSPIATVAAAAIVLINPVVGVGIMVGYALYRVGTIVFDTIDDWLHPIRPEQQALIDQLKDPNQKEEAANILHGMGARAVPFLLYSLKKMDSETSYSVRNIIVNMGDEAIPALLNALENNDNDIRKNAASIIRSIEPTDKKLIPALIPALSDNDFNVGYDTAITLAKIGADAVPALLKVIKKGGQNSKRNAVYALGFMDSVPQEAVPILIKILQNQDIYYRSFAATALGKSRDPHAIHVLRQALHDTEKKVRAEAAKALGKLNDREVIPELTKLLKDEFIEVRIAAIEAMRIIGITEDDTVTINSLIEIVQTTEDSDIKRAAIRVLGASSSESAVSILVAIARGQNQPQTMKIIALEALGSLGAVAKTAIPHLVEIIRTDPWNNGHYAAKALGNMGSEALPVVLELLRVGGNIPYTIFEDSAVKILVNEGIAAILHQLKGPRSYNRKVAIMALGKLSPEIANTPEIKAELVNALTDHLSSVREKAADALEQMGEAALPELIQLLRGEDDRLLTPAIKLLTRLGAKAVPSLTLLLSDENAIARRMAAKILIGLEDDAAPAVDALIKALNDEDENVQAFAASALSKIKKERKRIITAMLAQLTVSTSPRQEVTLIEALSDMKAEEATPYLISALVSETTRPAATEALGMMGKSAVLPLIDLIEKTNDLDIKTSAIIALASIGLLAEEAIPTLVKTLKDPQLNIVSLNALIALKDAALPSLKKIIEDRTEEPTLRIYAIEGMIKIGKNYKDVGELLWGILLDPTENSNARHAVGARITAISDGESISNKMQIDRKLAEYISRQTDALMDLILHPVKKAALNAIATQLGKERTAHPSERKIGEDEKLTLFEYLFSLSDDQVMNAKELFDQYFKNDPTQYTIDLNSLTELIRHIGLDGLERLIAILNDPYHSVEDILVLAQESLGALPEAEREYTKRKLRWIIENHRMLEEELQEIKELTVGMSSEDAMALLEAIDKANTPDALLSFTRPIGQIFKVKLSSMPPNEVTPFLIKIINALDSMKIAGKTRLNDAQKQEVLAKVRETMQSLPEQEQRRVLFGILTKLSRNKEDILTFLQLFEGQTPLQRLVSEFRDILNDADIQNIITTPLLTTEQKIALLTQLSKDPIDLILKKLPPEAATLQEDIRKISQKSAPTMGTKIPHVFFETVMKVSQFDSSVITSFQQVITAEPVRRTGLLKNLLYEKMVELSRTGYDNTQQIFSGILNAVKIQFHDFRDISKNGREVAETLKQRIEQMMTIKEVKANALGNVFVDFEGNPLHEENRKLRELAEVIEKELLEKNIFNKEAYEQMQKILSTIKINDLLAAFGNNVKIENRENVMRKLTEYRNTPAGRQKDYNGYDLYKLLQKYLKQKHENIFNTVLYDALIHEIEGTFSPWRYQSPDYIATLDAFIENEIKKNGVEDEFKIIDGKNPVEKLANSEYRDIKQNMGRIRTWEQPASKAITIGKEEYTLSFADDLFTLINVGNSPFFFSCQNCISGSYNEGLLGYIANGANKAIVVKNKDGTIIGRRIVRLRLVDNRPILFLEKMYGNKGEKEMLDFAREIAATMGLPLATLGQEEHKMVLFDGRSPYDYSDSYGRVLEGGDVGLYNHEKHNRQANQEVTKPITISVGMTIEEIPISALAEHIAAIPLNEIIPAAQAAAQEQAVAG